MSNDFFSDLMASISERGRNLLRRGGWSNATPLDATGVVALCEGLLSGRGEASGTVLARDVLDSYRTLDDQGRVEFFEALARSFGPDREQVEKAIDLWRSGVGGAGGGLHFATEPRRQELFRRLNRAPGGTGELVGMRADLLGAARDRKDLDTVDRDLAHLFVSWFNRGFSCCAVSIGRALQTFSRRSSVMRPCTRSTTGTTCAAASIRWIGAATPSSIRRCRTSR